MMLLLLGHSEVLTKLYHAYIYDCSMVLFEENLMPAGTRLAINTTEAAPTVIGGC